MKTILEGAEQKHQLKARALPWISLAVLVSALCAAAWGASGTLRITAWVNGEADASPKAEGLEAPNWRVRVDDQPANLLGVLGPETDLLLIVITDLTGNLAEAQLAKAALAEVLEELPSRVQVALMRAQDGLRVIEDPTPDRKAIREALERIPVTGRAGLLETILPAAGLGDSILGAAKVRVAVLYVTDSEVGNYREDFTNPRINASDSGDLSRRFRDGLIRDRIARLDKQLAATQTPVFIVHLNYRTDTLNQAYQTGLMSLAATTGGAGYFCRTQSEISAAVRKALAEIVSHCSLIVELRGWESGRTVEARIENEGSSLRWRPRYVLP